MSNGVRAPGPQQHISLMSVKLKTRINRATGRRKEAPRPSGAEPSKTQSAELRTSLSAAPPLHPSVTSMSLLQIALLRLERSTTVAEHVLND